MGRQCLPRLLLKYWLTIESAEPEFSSLWGSRVSVVNRAPRQLKRSHKQFISQ